MLRTFISVRIRMTDELRRLPEELGELGSALRVTKTDILHVTLKFLGDTEERLVPRIVELLRGVTDGIQPTEVVLYGLGAFPNVNRPSVVWVGLQGADELTSLAQRLDRDLAPLGFPLEKEGQRLHLTVARVKSRPPRELVSFLKQNSETTYGTSPVSSVEFYRSELLPGGPRHTVLESVPFGT